MSKIVITAVLVSLAVTAPLMAQTALAPSAKGGATADAKSRAFVNKYCVACHSKRVKNPAEAPVNLEAAGFDDLLAPCRHLGESPSEAERAGHAASRRAPSY